LLTAGWSRRKKNYVSSNTENKLYPSIIYLSRNHREIVTCRQVTKVWNKSQPNLEKKMEFETLKDFWKWKETWAKKKVARLRNKILDLDGIQIKIKSGILTQIQIGK